MIWTIVSWGDGQSDLYFMIEWFCPISWRLFDGGMSYLVNGSVWTQRLTLPNIFRSGTYISWFSDFAWHLEDYLMDEGHTLDNGSMWHKDWLHQIYLGQWPIFHGPVIWLNILETVWWRNVILGIMDQFDTKIDLMKYIWVSDLYFMVQWLCLISVRLFDECATYFR